MGREQEWKWSVIAVGAAVLAKRDKAGNCYMYKSDWQGLQAKALRIIWAWERSAAADRGCLLKTSIRLTLAALR